MNTARRAEVTARAKLERLGQKNRIVKRVLRAEHTVRNSIKLGEVFLTSLDSAVRSGRPLEKERDDIAEFVIGLRRVHKFLRPEHVLAEFEGDSKYAERRYLDYLAGVEEVIAASECGMLAVGARVDEIRKQSSDQAQAPSRRPRTETMRPSSVSDVRKRRRF